MHCDKNFEDDVTILLEGLNSWLKDSTCSTWSRDGEEKGELKS